MTIVTVTRASDVLMPRSELFKREGGRGHWRRSKSAFHLGTTHPAAIRDVITIALPPRDRDLSDGEQRLGASFSSNAHPFAAAFLGAVAEGRTDSGSTRCTRNTRESNMSTRHTTISKGLFRHCFCSLSSSQLPMLCSSSVVSASAIR